MSERDTIGAARCNLPSQIDSSKRPAMASQAVSSKQDTEHGPAALFMGSMATESGRADAVVVGPPSSLSLTSHTSVPAHLASKPQKDTRNNHNAEPGPASGAPPRRPLLPKLSSDEGPGPADYLERRKNEIVQELLLKIRPFVSPSGSISPKADLDAFAALMKNETHFVQRSVLITVLAVAPHGPDEDEFRLRMGRLVGNENVLKALELWLAEAIKEESPLLQKILDLLLMLPFTVDILMKHKFGKAIKKLTTVSNKEEVDVKAARLFDAWQKLARGASVDQKQRGSNDSRPAEPSRKHALAASSMMPVSAGGAFVRKPADPALLAARPVRPSSSSLATTATATAVENFDLFSDPSLTKFPIQNRASLVLERAARGESASLSTRPISADDIHKEKKRRMYMEVSKGQGSKEVEAPVELAEETPTSLPAKSESPSLMAPHVRSLQEYRQKTTRSLPAEDDTQQDDVSAQRSWLPPAPQTTAGKKRVSFADETSLCRVRYFTPEDEEWNEKPLHTDYHEIDRQEASYAFSRLREAMDAEIDWEAPKRLHLQEELVCGDEGRLSEEKAIQEQREKTALSAVYLSTEHIPPSPLEANVDMAKAEEPGRARHIALHEKDQTGKPLVRNVPPPVDEMASRGVDASLLSTLLHNPNIIQNLLGQISGSHASIGTGSGGDKFPGFPFMDAGMGAAGGNSARPAHFIPMRGGMAGNQAGQRPAGIPRTQLPKNKRPVCKWYRSGQPNSCRHGESCTFQHLD